MITRDQYLTVRAVSQSAAARFFADNYGVPDTVIPERTATDQYGAATWRVPASAATEQTRKPSEGLSE